MVKIKPIKKTKRDGLVDDILSNTYVSKNAVPSFDEDEDMSTVQKLRKIEKNKKENENTVDLNRILRVMDENDQDNAFDIQIDEIDEDMQEYDVSTK